VAACRKMSCFDNSGHDIFISIPPDYRKKIYVEIKNHLNVQKGQTQLYKCWCKSGLSRCKCWGRGAAGAWECNAGCRRVWWT
jgi:hypothetical protein